MFSNKKRSKSQEECDLPLLICPRKLYISISYCTKYPLLTSYVYIEVIGHPFQVISGTDTNMLGILVRHDLDKIQFIEMPFIFVG